MLKYLGPSECSCKALFAKTPWQAESKIIFRNTIKIDDFLENCVYFSEFDLFLIRVSKVSFRVESSQQV